MKACFLQQKPTIQTIIILSILLLGTACSNQSLPQGEDLLLYGEVSSTDGTPMFVDGDGLIFLKSRDHGEVTIHIPARERICKATGLELFASITSGDSVAVNGRVTGPRAVTVCEDEAHFLEQMK